MQFTRFTHCALFSTLIAVTPIAFAGDYVQLSSPTTQVASNANTPAMVAIEDVDTGQGITKNSNSTEFTVKQSGNYFIMAAAQVGAQKGSGRNGAVNLWLVKNGRPISNSNTQQNIGNESTTAVLISQTILPLKQGDRISVSFSASNTSLGLISTPMTNNEPAIPSIIFSMFKM